MLGMLGEGTYGEVHLAKDKKTGRKVAIKVGEKRREIMHIISLKQSRKTVRFFCLSNLALVTFGKLVLFAKEIF